jgi:curved DNA-binding protein
MPLEFKDYYVVLGVPPTASDADIKKAFRNLARKYHPDVARDKKSAESRFKEINEANEVLSDPEKRRKYDELGANWNQPGRATPPPRGGFGGARGGGAEFHFDGTGFSDFFEQFFGGRSRPGGDFGPAGGEEEMRGAAAARAGRDIESDLLVTLAEVLQGSVRSIRLQRTDPRTGQSAVQTLQVKIPPGVREGQLIRLAGKGQEGGGGGPAGHLYLRVKLAAHPLFRVRGANLYHDLEVSPWEAVLGTRVDLPTLDGVASLKIPPGTAAEQEFRLRGQGLPTAAGTRGDLHVVVSIQVPSQVTPGERALWEQLAAKSPFNPRKTHEQAP